MTWRKLVKDDKGRPTGLLPSLLIYSEWLTCIQPCDCTLLSIVICFSRHTYLPFDKQTQDSFQLTFQIKLPISNMALMAMFLRWINYLHQWQIMCSNPLFLPLDPNHTEIRARTYSIFLVQISFAISVPLIFNF